MAELQYSSLISDANLISYWRLNGDFVDSKSGYDLTPGAGVPTDITGKFAGGKGFASASSQYASIANASCPNLEISGSQTWICWAKPATALAWQWLMCKANGQRGLGMTGDTGKYRFRVNGLSTTNDISSDVAVSTGSWVFLAGIYDSANSKIKIWVNTTKKEATAGGTATDQDGDFYLGSRTGGDYLNADLDDCYVFNRALTDAEIGILYNDLSATANQLKQYRRTRVPGAITG
ncbi:LamG domain-containing protein [Candidatus Roizmanbacteria bacterium]|nr:LamG domain-containing protein [Candidatus Roizmanbacteria bacterium]